MSRFGFLPVIVGTIYTPAVLALSFLMTGSGPADMLTSSSILVIYLIPALAIVASIQGHFRFGSIFWALGLIAALELGSMLPGYAPFDLLARAAQLVAFQEVAPDVLGKSLFLVCALAMVSLAALFRGLTLFRLVMGVMVAAQCVVLVLFHLTTISWPLQGVLEQERQMVRSAVMRDAGLSSLCAFDGRTCMTGTPDDALGWAERALVQSRQTRSFVEDTRSMSPILFSWIENPAPGALDTVSVITGYKAQADEIQLMASVAGPSAVYAEMRKSAGILIVAFHQAWVMLGLLILWRHRPARVTWRGWVPAGPVRPASE